MKHSIQFGLALCALVCFGCEPRRGESGPPEPTQTKPAPPIAPKVAAKTFGDSVPSAPATQLDAVLDQPQAYADRELIVEGEVKRACSKKGCWMELGVGHEESSPSCRVTFKDYGFFVPTDSAGKHARLVGQVSTKTLSRAHAEHLEAEGARLAHKNPDGSALEVQIVARGVELR